jgi:hypothetical protein
MRWSLLAALVACASLAGSARAELQVFQGTFSLVGLGGPVEASTAIGVATVNGSGGGSHVATLALPGDLFSIHTTVPVTGGTLPITGVKVDVTLAAGSLAVGSAGTLSGVLPAPGIVRVCVALGCGIGFDVPLTEGGTRGLGIGGPPIEAPLGGLGTLSLAGGPWETGQALVVTSAGSVGLTGFAHGPLSGTSSTAEPQGVLQLVTPVAVGASVSGAPPTVIPIFGLLELRLLPEPGAAAGFAASGVLLALLGRRRARARR